MPKRSELSISKRTVDALAVEGKDTTFWDRELPGFGVRVYPSGTRIYIVQSRGPVGIKRVSLGRHGDVTAEQARKKAAAAIARIKKGEDPVARPLPALSIAQLAERYLEAHVAVHCNAHTQGITASRRRPWATAGRSSGTSCRGWARCRSPSSTARTLPSFSIACARGRLRRTTRWAALSRMLNRAQAWGLLPGGSNPCRFVKPYRMRRPERFLTEEEFRRLGQALDDMEAEGRLPVSRRGGVQAADADGVPLGRGADASLEGRGAGAERDQVGR